jgi:RNA polymerase sigma factor (sigma-70 family)
VWEDWNAEAQLSWERAVFSRMRRGDLASFGLLYDAFAKRLVRHVLAPKLGHRAAIEDALAETFRKAFEARATYVQKDTSVYFWLARIAERVVLDTHRTERRVGALERVFSSEPNEGAQSPEAAYASREVGALERARMDAALTRLSPRHRAAITLRILEERPREECAARLGVRIGTFDVLLLRAVRALTTQLEEVGDDRRS